MHIFVFTDLKNNRFQKKLIVQNTIYEYSPSQLSTLATLLVLHAKKIVKKQFFFVHLPLKMPVHKFFWLFIFLDIALSTI